MPTSVPFLRCGAIASLKEDIPTEYLADSVGLSHFYFQRLFKRLVKKPVQEYIKLRRLAKVIPILNDSDQRLLDIALADRLRTGKKLLI